MRGKPPELVAGWRIDAVAAGVFAFSPADGPAALAARATVGEADLALLTDLAAVDPSALDGGARVDLIRAFDRAKAALDAAQQRALSAVIESTEAAGFEGDLARHEVGAALRLSPGTAYERTRVAAELTSRLSETLGALEHGSISYWQARSIAEAVRGLPDAQTAEVQSRVLAPAGSMTAAETRRAVERAVLAADPAGAASRHRTARAERRVSLCPQPDAMTGLWATMTAVDGAHVWEALTAQARAAQTRLRDAGDDEPGMDALRVDTLVALLTGRPLPGAATPTATGEPAHGRRTAESRPAVGVVVDLPTLLHLADHPAELPGYGWVPAVLAREMAADADWVRWTVDGGTHRLLDHGAHRYRPGAMLARHVAAEHGVCGFPGCARAADRCDLDHTIDFRRGGRTERINLGPLCRQHHNAKTHGGWLLHFDHDTGTKTWTSPLGKTYLKGPKRYPPDG